MSEEWLKSCFSARDALFLRQHINIVGESEENQYILGKSRED